MAVRAALGATRRAVVRLLVLESLMIGLAGAMGGLAGTVALTRLLRYIVPTLPVPVSIDFGLDWRVMAFAVTIAIGASLFFGLLPALFGTRTEVRSVASTDRSTDPLPQLRLRRAFAAAQVAFSVLLVIVAALLAKSARNAAAIDPGFDTGHVDLVELDLRLGGQDDVSGAAFVPQLLSEIGGLPGIVSAAATWIVPLQLRATSTTVSTSGTGTEAQRLSALWNVVSPGYFDTIGLPLIAGRSFSSSDRTGAADVAIVNETLARRLWPGQTAVGRLMADGEGRSMAVIGIVRDSIYRGIGEPPQPFFYRPWSQQHQQQVSVLIRRGPGGAIPGVRRLLQKLDPDLPILRATTFEEATGFSLFPQRLAMWTASSSATIGVFLAILGLYGITAYEVTRRVREIGVRLAVGATPRQVIALVVRRAVGVATAGMLLGLLFAASAGRALAGLLFGVGAFDPISFLTGAAVCVVVTLMASAFPALRAARTDPMSAIRDA
jgi:predicted permease